MGEDSWLWKKQGGVRRKRRVHGLQTPLHPQQVIGWVVVIVMIAFMYGAVVPALHSNFVAPVAAASATLFLAHLISHATALALDPAHPLLRDRKDKRLVPEFDRSIHLHVIENGRCHLCNITITSMRTKHCSSCNKCVDVFDHHCKWLNNCIGQRNYRVFLATVITAILSCLMVMATCLTEIILYYFNRQYLAPWENGIPTIHPPDETGEIREENHLTCEAGSPYCHFSVFGARVYDGAFIGILSSLFSLALVAGVLLVHLVAFHAYLLVLGLTTYEYIRGTNVSSDGHTYGGRAGSSRDGAACGWSANSRPSTNQITPSSTTDTALLSSPDTPNTTTTTPGTLSPRSNPSTPADDSRQLLGGRHAMAHHKQPLSPRALFPSSSNSSSSLTMPSRSSSVPTLPKIPGAQRSSIKSLSKNISEASSVNSMEDPDLTYHLVAIPRPPRVSRRRLRSSIAPHLSPIKECDIASSSPPSVRTFSPSSSRPNSGRDSSISCTTPSPSSILKASRSPRPSRARSSPSPSRSKRHISYFNGEEGNYLVKVSGRDQSSAAMPSPRRRQDSLSVSKTPNHSGSSSKSPSRRFSSSPSHLTSIRKSSSFNDSSRIGTPTLRFKIPKDLSNGHIVTNGDSTTIITANGVDHGSPNGHLISIVRSQSDGLLIKMGEVTKGGVYIGPHKPDPFVAAAPRSKNNAKSFVEHHM